MTVADVVAYAVVPALLLFGLVVLALVAVDQARGRRKAERQLEQMQDCADQLAAELAHVYSAAQRAATTVKLRPAVPPAPRFAGDRLLTNMQPPASVFPRVPLPAHIAAERPVWIADERNGVVFHALNMAGTCTGCEVPVRRRDGGGFGKTMPASTAATWWAGRPCSRCFPTVPIVPGAAG